MEKRVKIPKKVLDVIAHYNQCFAERGRCLHCNDCIAFALINSESLKLRLPPRGVPYSVGLGHAWNFVKFLASTISKEYLPCERALPYKRIKSFAWALLRLSITERRHVRSCLITHAEFLEPTYTDGVRVYVMSPAKFEAYRRES